MEIFKESKKSICHNCKNVNEKCYKRVTQITCGTDSKIGKAFVEKCTSFNKPLGLKNYNKNTVSTKHAVDTRVEMMGGGHG